MKRNLIFATCFSLFSTSAIANINDEEFIDLDAVCVPAIQALQEPTTEFNLGPQDTFDDELLEASESPLPAAEPTTMVVVTYLLKAIAIEVGNRIFDQYFKKVKSGLVEADFKRIEEIVKNALREDAKRKTENCLTSIQAAHYRIAGSRFIRERALKIDSTTSAMLVNIENFDHDFTRMGLMGGGVAVAAMQLGLVQEMGKHMDEIDEGYFNKTKEMSAKFIKDYLDDTERKFLDKSNPDLFKTEWKTRKVNSKDELNYDFRGFIYGKLDFFRSGECDGTDGPKRGVTKCSRLKKSFEAQVTNMWNDRTNGIRKAAWYNDLDGQFNMDEAYKKILATPFTN